MQVQNIGFIVTGHETWLLQWDLRTKQEPMQCKGSLTPKILVSAIMAAIFWVSKGMCTEQFPAFLPYLSSGTDLLN